jgi:hypothetical protein
MGGAVMRVLEGPWLAITVLLLGACGDTGNSQDSGAGLDPGVVADESSADTTTPPGPIKVDLLLVVDDSPSMCQEQQTLANMFRTMAMFEDMDLRVAVTTTNVCPTTDSSAIRGRFVYRPAKDLPLDCRRQNRVAACLTDADCQADSSLLDAQNWACDAPSQSAALYTCDTPPNPVLLSVNASCRYQCSEEDDQCPAIFGEGHWCHPFTSIALEPGCSPPLDTMACPENGPTILDAEVVNQYLAAWRRGDWAGDASWAGRSDDEVRPLVRELLFHCLAFVGSDQSLCANQEQGLRAAWMALDPDGENGEQAGDFVREDAFLLIVVLSDEDDCSAPDTCDRRDVMTGLILRNVDCVDADSVSRCACLLDENGCPPGRSPGESECEPSRCSQNGSYVRGNCPLESPDMMANRLKGLKDDPAKVFVAVITGDVVPNSATTPGDDLEAARSRYYECHCDKKPSSTATYACLSTGGKALLGSRYQAVAKAFGFNGVAINICDDNGIRDGLYSAFQAILMTAGR